MQISLLTDWNGHNESLAGFRLQRFEVLNWGTFDKRPWVLNLAGETALLTGANGSGKSTLIDGFLTLLVPNKKRNYNQASSTSGKRERDEKSYVQGAYGRTRAEDSHSSKSKLLREKGTLSVLLAYFLDAAIEQKVTIAQVLWIEEGMVRKFFVVANDELAIASHFTQFTHVSDLKKRLRALGAEVFDEFIKYSQQFCKRFGLQSEKALDLFNQTVSIKEIGGLNEFVRNHMLEKTDVREQIQKLQESYENLIASYNEIQKARKQLESLIPLSEEAEKYNRIQQELTRLQNLREIAPVFFAQRKLELLEEELRAIEQQLTQANHRQEECDRQLDALRQQEQRLVIAISQDDIGQRLQELTREIEQQKKEVANKKRQAQKYDELAKLLSLSQYRDSDTFYAIRAQGDVLKDEIDEILQDLQTQRDKLIIQHQELQNQLTELKSESDSLKKRKSQIPKENLDIRDRLIQKLNLDEADLPFVGELLQVRPEAREWEGAIERLLRSFGLCLLVPEQHYQEVNAYVNNTHLGGYLVYYRITPLTTNPTQRAFDPHHVPHKLEIKENLVFYGWVRDRLVSQYNYLCCDTVEQFQHQARAITCNGLIKHGGERHEKNDRSRVGDRRNYILGWNNIDKIKAIEAECQQVSQQLTHVEKQIQSLDRQRKQRTQQQSELQSFMSFTDFAEIDWRTIELNRQTFERQRQELEASSDRLKQLETQLEKVRQELDYTSQERDKIIRTINTLESRQTNATNQKSYCKARFSQSSTQQIETFANQMVKKFQHYSLTLDTVDQAEQEICNFFLEEIEREKSKQDSSKNSILMRMLNFRNVFPEATIDIGTSLESLEEYLQLKNKIEQDDLPRHEQNFKKLMNEKIIQAISFFKFDLDKQEEDIQNSIDDLNQSLRQINYTDSTYIELRYEATRDREIRDFKKDLVTCLGDITLYSAEDNERRFRNIQTLLIKRFQEEDKWTNKVIDVRNWLDFSVSERYRADNTEKEHHTDSSGKSGGQKAKLAYTILASAIAYQFGINREDKRSKSFRFVVIDEAFSKSDDDNARYAMELFKNLNLQLLVVTPKDKINVIESYIASLHFVSNNTEGNYSRLISVSMEEYQQERQAALSKSYD